MPPIQPIKATDTDDARRSKQNAAITRVNQLDGTATDIAAFASSANAAARNAAAARDQARQYAEGVTASTEEATEAAGVATAARVAAVTARNQAEAFRNETNEAKDQAAQSAVTAGEHRDEANEARDAAAISRGAAQVAAAAALLSATESEAERQEAEAAAARAEEAENSLLEWQGQWVTLKAYKVGDIARHDGTSYVCEEAHTAGVFLTDMADGKWSVFAQRGASGPGSGDMLEAVYDPQGIGLDAFARANHTGQQAITTVTGLQSALDGKSAVGHGHPIANITGLEAALDGKAPTSHGHAMSAITNLIATFDRLIPLGTVQPWLGRRDAIPDGWLPIDGQWLERSTVQAYFNWVSSRFEFVNEPDWWGHLHQRGRHSWGNGSTHFRMPDLNGMQEGSRRGLFLRGDGYGSVAPGHVWEDAIRNIWGEFSHAAWDKHGSGAFVQGSFRNGPAGIAQNNQANVNFDASRVVPTADENRPVSVAVCWITRVW